MEDEKFEDEEENSGDVKSWFSDNLRIIISIIIVIIIAGGVYSYSKRSQAPTEENQAIQTEESTEQIAGDETQNANPVEVEKKEEKSQPKETAQQPAEEKKSETSSTTISQETENSFVETAGKGDGTTHLARKALANYLEKNPDSGLTAEHKIFIEDYLSKKVGSGKLSMGASKEFSKDTIKQAIEASKQLNEKQLNNLHKYSVRVPSLS